MAVHPPQSYGRRLLDKRSNRFGRSSGQGTLGIRMDDALGWYQKQKEGLEAEFKDAVV